jgi:DNA-binding GntR family transcriptional regulator
MTVEPPPFGFAQAREVFVQFGALHAEATRRGVPALDTAGLERMRSADAACGAALRDGRVDDAIDSDDRFHDVLVEAAGDPDLRVGIDLMRPRVRRLDRWYFAQGALHHGTVATTHAEILAACEAGDAEEAARLVHESFLSGGERIAAALERR